MVKYNKIPRKNFLRLVSLKYRLESVTKEFQSLCEKDCPCSLVAFKLEQCCDLFNVIVYYAQIKI